MESEKGEEIFCVAPTIFQFSIIAPFVKTSFSGRMNLKFCKKILILFYY